MNQIKINKRDKEEVFVYYYDGKPMTLAQNANSQWRPPKKVFYSLGVARANPPSHYDMRKAGLDPAKLSIVKYTPNGQVFDTYHPNWTYHDTNARPWTYKVKLPGGTFEIFDDSRKAQKRVEELRKKQREAENGRS